MQQHLRRLLHKLKNTVGGIVNRHPYFWYAAWSLLPRLRFLLPHEKSYYAFRHLAKQDGGLFLDVGANNGLSALGFRRLVSQYKIFSIEANRIHENSLRRLKQKLKNFDYLIAAAGAEDLEITLHTATYNGMVLHTGSSVNLAYLKGSVEKAFPNRVLRNLNYVAQVVKVIPLDDLNLTPDIVKLDVEGFEWETLSGFKQTIAKCRPSILIEFSPELGDRLVPFCDDLRFRTFVYDDLADRFIEFDVERQALIRTWGASPINLFLIPSEKVVGLPISPEPAEKVATQQD